MVAVVERDDVARMKTEILQFSTSFFVGRGFRWLLPKVLSPITDPLWPDPAEQGIEPLEVEVKTYGQKFRLVHSLILHKQIAVAEGIDRLFFLSPNIRIESRRPDGWHAFEFTQLDFEGKHLTMYDVMSLLSEYLRGLTDHLHEKGLIDKHEEPFRYFRMRFGEYDWGRVLEEFGNDEELLKAEKRPFFITNIPREFYDYKDDKTGRWRNYDLYIPPWGEVSSGGEREWEYEKILLKIKEGDLDPKAFEPYLRYAKEGKLRPSAGAGIGVERIVTVFLRASDIAEAQIFPRIPFTRVEV